MSQLQYCIMCSQPAKYLCNCSPSSFLCLKHLHPHNISTPGQHLFHPLQFPIFPQDIQILQNIQNTLLSRIQQKVQEKLKIREENLTPLLQQIQNIEKQIEQDIKIITEQENEKIKEIQDMLKTRELKGRKQDIFLKRGQESLGTVAKRIYLEEEKVDPSQQTIEEEKVRNKKRKFRDLIIEPIKTLMGHSNSINNLAFSPKKEQLASGSNGKNIGMWEVSSVERIKTLTGHSSSVWSVAFSPNGKYLASGSADKTISIWRVSSGERTKTLTGHLSDVKSIVFSPNGQYLASGSDDKTIGVWRVQDGKRIKTLRGHNRSVNSVVFSPNGEYLASGSKDNTIGLWSVSNAEPVEPLSGGSAKGLSLIF